MRPIRILHWAAEEAAKAAAWYEAEWPGLGTEFIEAVEKGLDTIEDNFLPLAPMPGDPGAMGAKRLVLKQFPHDIVVVERDHEALVIAIAHHSQVPSMAG